MKKVKGDLGELRIQKNNRLIVIWLAKERGIIIRFAHEAFSQPQISVAGSFDICVCLSGEIDKEKRR